MITINDFQTNGYVVPMPQTNETVTNNGVATHHKQIYGQRFASAQGTLAYAPCVYNLNLNAGTDTVFLPYYQDQAASVRLPGTGPVLFFVTSNLSGCAIYIGVNNNNRLIVTHSNSQTGSDRLTMDNNVPSYQSRRAIRELDLYAQNARNNHGGAVRTVFVLTKAVYLGALDALAANGGQWLGGTTVAGWRTPNTNNWQFHYQVWGSVRGGPVQLVRSREFYRNF